MVSFTAVTTLGRVVHANSIDLLKPIFGGLSRLFSSGSNKGIYIYIKEECKTGEAINGVFQNLTCSKLKLNRWKD